MQRLGVQAIGQPGGIGRRRPSTRRRCTGCTGWLATANRAPARPGDVPHNTESLNPVQARAAAPIGGMRPSQEPMPENRLLRLLAAYPIVVAALTILELVVRARNGPLAIFAVLEPLAFVAGLLLMPAAFIRSARTLRLACSPGRGRRGAVRRRVGIDQATSPSVRSRRQTAQGRSSAGRPPAANLWRSRISVDRAQRDRVPLQTATPLSDDVASAGDNLALPVDELRPYRRSELEAVGPDDLVATAGLDVDDPCRRRPSQVELQSHRADPGAAAEDLPAVHGAGRPGGQR
jgi:hypothetical protein